MKETLSNRAFNTAVNKAVRECLATVKGPYKVTPWGYMFNSINNGEFWVQEERQGTIFKNYITIININIFNKDPQSIQLKITKEENLELARKIGNWIDPLFDMDVLIVKDY